MLFGTLRRLNHQIAPAGTFHAVLSLGIEYGSLASQLRQTNHEQAIANNGLTHLEQDRF
jgi:hypothetical protein